MHFKVRSVVGILVFVAPVRRKGDDYAESARFHELLGLGNLICRACAHKYTLAARGMHFVGGLTWCLMDLLCLCAGGPSDEPRDAQSVPFKDVIGAWHSGLT